MTKKIVLFGLELALIAGVGLFLLLPSEGRSQAKPTPAVASSDQKLDEITSRLDRIERRLAEIAPPTSAVPRLPSEQALASRTFAERTASKLPYVADKPKPHSSFINGCKPRGKGGDEDLNYLKNRIDEVDEWMEVSFDAVYGQPYPPTVGKVDRADWDEADTAAVKRFEGLPISIECYFAWAKDEGKESCNCGIEDKSMYDIHTWLVKKPPEIDGNKAPDRSNAIVAEVTPRLKPDHPKWTAAAIRRLAKAGQKVRVSGWLMLDQEHPEQLTAHGTQSATRGTLWEIHPIMDVEVWNDNGWVSLDDLADAPNVARLPVGVFSVAAPIEAADSVQAKKDPQSSFEPRSQPGAGQNFLAGFVGDWNVVKKFYPRSGDPVEASGTCHQTMINDGRFLRSEFTFTRNGETTKGLGIIGFDTDSGKFTSFWTDSRSTKMSIRQSEEKFDGEQIVLLSRTLDKDDRNARRSRTVTRMEDSGRRIVHRQYAIDQKGDERLMMELNMTRLDK